jgi:CheY-like chemotaxis protein
MHPPDKIGSGPFVVDLDPVVARQKHDQRDIRLNTREIPRLRALEMLEAGSYDGVLMDVAMPVMDGLEATRQQRERELISGEHVTIVAMTANAMKGDRESCLNAGMDDYVTKPIQAAVLFDSVERIPLSDVSKPSGEPSGDPSPHIG